MVSDGMEAARRAAASRPLITRTIASLIGVAIL
jgi:hypothetical protein